MNPTQVGETKIAGDELVVVVDAPLLERRHVVLRTRMKGERNSHFGVVISP